MRIKVYILILLFIAPNLFLAHPSSDSTQIYGVTIDATNNIHQITVALSKHSKKMTARIVFDDGIPSTNYSKPIEQIHKVSYIMGELLDSYGFSKYSLKQYEDRVNDYVNTLGGKIDIWEIGNEVNGEWLGNSDSVVAKITAAYRIVKAQKMKTALTLYYNTECTDYPDIEMFKWINYKLSSEMRNGLEYVLISFYEDDCNNFKPDWEAVFDSLHTLFPNSKLGIGECGTKILSKKTDYITRYYTMKINTPGYIGGYFWWYYRQDCVPYTKPLWQVLDNTLTP